MSNITKSMQSTSNHYDNPLERFQTKISYRYIQGLFYKMYLYSLSIGLQSDKSALTAVNLAENRLLK